jgi:hypothetical protein
MCLLSDLLSNTSNHTTFLNLLNGQSILPRLLPFLNHPNLGVRQTTLHTINKIITAINNNTTTVVTFESVESPQTLTLLFRLLFQQAILMSSETHFTQLESILVQLWRTLTTTLNCSSLVALCFPYITTWLYLFMWPPTQQIESTYLVNNQESNFSR